MHLVWPKQQMQQIGASNAPFGIASSIVLNTNTSIDRNIHK